MNKLLKSLAVIGLSILLIVQIICINNYEKEKNNKAYNSQHKPQVKQKSLVEFSEDLNCLKEKNILAADKINGKWFVKLKIIGSKEELLEEIGKLKDYDINEYSISKNKDENSIIIQLTSKGNS